MWSMNQERVRLHKVAAEEVYRLAVACELTELATYAAGCRDAFAMILADGDNSRDALGRAAIKDAVTVSGHQAVREVRNEIFGRK